MNNILRNLFKRNHYPATEYQTEYAFTCGGVDYYKLTDFNNMPALRGMKTLVFYEELSCKCSPEYLTMHTEAIDNLLTNPQKIDLFAIKKLNDQLKQRLTIAVDLEAVYKIASIVFFDKQENITDYDYGYNAKKIAQWKKEGADAFFLLKPIRALVPVLQHIDENLQNYSHVQQELNALHLDNLLQHLPERKIKK